VNITYLHDYRRHRDPDEPLLTVDMFARRVGTSSSTVRRWMVEDGPIGPMPFECRAGMSLIDGDGLLPIRGRCAGGKWRSLRDGQPAIEGEHEPTTFAGPLEGRNPQGR
jgi:hypothetical protein